MISYQVELKSQLDGWENHQSVLPVEMSDMASFQLIQAFDVSPGHEEGRKTSYSDL